MLRLIRRLHLLGSTGQATPAETTSAVSVVHPKRRPAITIPTSFVITHVIVSIFRHRPRAHVMRRPGASHQAGFCRRDDPGKPAAALEHHQIMTFDDDVFPTLSRNIFAGPPLWSQALAPVPAQ
jgi:hypothetical protein